MNILGSLRILPHFPETHCGTRDLVINLLVNINRKEEEGAAHIPCLPYAASKGREHHHLTKVRAEPKRHEHQEVRRREEDQMNKETSVNIKR